MSGATAFEWCRRVWTDLPLRRKGVIVTLIPVLPLVMTAWLFYWSAHNERAAQVWVIRTVEVRGGLDTALSLLTEAETGVRGYLLTSKPQFLDPYENAIRSLPATFARLQTQMLDPGQLDRLAQLRLLAERRLQLLELTLRHIQTAGQPLATIPQDLLVQGNSLMDRVRVEVATMRSVQDALLAERTAHALRAEQWSLVVTLAGTVIGVVGGLLAAWLFTSGIGRRVDRLHENARLLSDGRPLLTGPRGRDEIGQLGQTLEEASALLASREQALRDASEELDRFFSSSLDLFCIADFNGYFRRLNSTWTSTLGWTADELMARPYAEFIHPDDVAATSQESTNLTAGVPTMTFVNRYRTKTGSYRWLEWKAMPVVDRGLIYAGARDITEQKAAEAMARDARDEAERASRAKSDFLSRMSHDLRTPLNAILGFAQLLATEPLESAQQDSVKQILKGGRHLLDLINEVLDLARIESGRLALSPEPVAVGDVVQQAVDLVRPLAAQREISLDVDSAAASDKYVVADRQRLNQVLHNLLSNAIKYNQVGGRVAVSAEHHPNHRLRITVTDTGPGIRPHELERLFQPFERLGAEQTATDGTGLGLVVAKSLAQAMGGLIGVRSQVDHGSTFWIELPQTEAPTSHIAQKDADSRGAAEPSTSEGTVLYIEDNVSNRVLMERVLARRPSVRLTTAATGAAGLEMAHSQRPDLILLDIHLPDIPGAEVLRQLWADPETRSIPVSVLSADATPGQIRRLLAAGARAYLTKPLDVDGVLRLIDETLAGKTGELSATGSQAPSESAAVASS